MATAFDTQAGFGFLRSQTAHIETQVYQTKYPDFNYAELIPVDTSADEWSKSITFYSQDEAGAAQLIAENGFDIPVVGLNRKEHESNVHMAGIGYDYTIAEVEFARRQNVNLTGDKAASARKAYERFVYEWALKGNAATASEGLFSSSAVTPVAGSAWSGLTADQILEQINDQLASIGTTTKYIEVADTLLIPRALWKVMGKRMDGTNENLFQYVQRNNLYTMETGRPLTVRGNRLLDEAGAGGVTRMVAYRRDPEVLKLHVPMAHRFMPAQLTGMRYVIPGIFRLAGLDIRLPGAVSYYDGV